MGKYKTSIKIELVEQIVGGNTVFYQATINNVNGILDIPSLVTNKIKHLYTTLSKPKPASDVADIHVNVEFESKYNTTYTTITSDETVRLLNDEYVYVTPEEIIDEYNNACRFNVFNDISKCRLYIRTKDKDDVISTDDALHINVIELYKRKEEDSYDKLLNITTILTNYLQLHEDDELSTLCYMTYKDTEYDKEINVREYFSRRWDMESEENLFSLFCELTGN